MRFSITRLRDSDVRLAPLSADTYLVSTHFSSPRILTKFPSFDPTTLHSYAIRIIFAGQTTCVSANETATRIFNGEFIQSRVDFFKYLLSRKTVNPSSVDEARVTTTTLTDFPRRDLYYSSLLFSHIRRRITIKRRW